MHRQTKKRISLMKNHASTTKHDSPPQRRSYLQPPLMYNSQNTVSTTQDELTHQGAHYQTIGNPYSTTQIFIDRHDNCLR